MKTIYETTMRAQIPASVNDNEATAQLRKIRRAFTVIAYCMDQYQSSHHPKGYLGSEVVESADGVIATFRFTNKKVAARFVSAMNQLDREGGKLELAA